MIGRKVVERETVKDPLKKVKDEKASGLEWYWSGNVEIWFKYAWSRKDWDREGMKMEEEKIIGGRVNRWP